MPSLNPSCSLSLLQSLHLQKYSHFHCQKCPCLSLEFYHASIHPQMLYVLKVVSFKWYVSFHSLFFLAFNYCYLTYYTFSVYTANGVLLYKAECLCSLHLHTVLVTFKEPDAYVTTSVRPWVVVTMDILLSFSLDNSYLIRNLLDVCISKM